MVQDTMIWNCKFEVIKLLSTYLCCFFHHSCIWFFKTNKLSQNRSMWRNWVSAYLDGMFLSSFSNRDFIKQRLVNFLLLYSLLPLLVMSWCQVGRRSESMITKHPIHFQYRMSPFIRPMRRSFPCIQITSSRHFHPFRAVIHLSASDKRRRQARGDVISALF